MLLDAPCSSDRHVLQQAVERRREISKVEWSVAKCNEVARLQAKLLLSALRAVKVGGRVIYSTCSIAPCENDDCVIAAMKLMGAAAATRIVRGTVDGIDPVKDLGAEETKCGWIWLPDRSCGPMYLCILEKVAPLAPVVRALGGVQSRANREAEREAAEEAGEPEEVEEELEEGIRFLEIKPKPKTVKAETTESA